MAVDTNRRWKTRLAIGAWGVLVAIVLGYLTYVPAVFAFIEAYNPAATLLIIVPVLGTALLCWIAGVQYALANQRRGLAVILGITGFVGGFFYYFFNVLWQRTSPSGGLTRS